MPLVYFLGDITVAGDGAHYRGTVETMAAQLDLRASGDPEVPLHRCSPHPLGSRRGIAPRGDMDDQHGSPDLLANFCDETDCDETDWASKEGIVPADLHLCSSVCGRVTLTRNSGAGQRRLGIGVRRVCSDNANQALAGVSNFLQASALGPQAAHGTHGSTRPAQQWLRPCIAWSVSLYCVWLLQANGAGVIINSMGWIDGLGYDLMLHSIRAFKVCFRVEFSQTSIFTSFNCYSQLRPAKWSVQFRLGRAKGAPGKPAVNLCAGRQSHSAR